MSSAKPNDLAALSAELRLSINRMIALDRDAQQETSRLIDRCVVLRKTTEEVLMWIKESSVDIDGITDEEVARKARLQFAEKILARSRHPPSKA
jgi:hypothetical protein